jgi:hypothetical protein
MYSILDQIIHYQYPDGFSFMFPISIAQKYLSHREEIIVHVLSTFGTVKDMGGLRAERLRLYEASPQPRTSFFSWAKRLCAIRQWWEDGGGL